MRAIDRLFQRPGISVALLVAAVVACAVMCCAAWLVAAYVSEVFEDYPTTLLDTEVTVDPDALQTNSYEEWYQTARQLLTDRGWEPSGNLTLLNAQVPCSSPSSLYGLHFGFTSVQFATAIPHLNMASVTLDCSTGTASVQIEDQGPGLRKHRTMDLSEVTVGLNEAVTIAEAHGGQALRHQLENACDIIVTLSDYEWYIDYLDEATSSLPALTVRVNARSGRIDTK
jgi:hypothetical protein